MHTREQRTLIEVVLRLGQIHQAGIDIRDEVVRNFVRREYGLRMYDTNELVEAVARELETIRYNRELPLAVSAEGLQEDCVEIRKVRSTAKERKC